MANSDGAAAPCRASIAVGGLGQSLIGGHVAPGFEPVLAVFESQFRSGNEIGAACAAYVGGQCVVDLWGGQRVPGAEEPWTRDTLALVMSTTKGLSAMAMAVAHSKGLFDYDDPVAQHWPDFAQNGKSAITIRQLMAHQAGLPAIDTFLTKSLFANLDELAPILARQKPAWPAGDRHGYHSVSLGHFQNELIRRVDPKGRTIGQFFQEEIALPMGGGMYIGLPDQIPDTRLAGIKVQQSWQAARELPLSFFLGLMNPFGLAAKSSRNPKFRKFEDILSRDTLRLEFPSLNGMVTARAVAKTYAAFAALSPQLGLNRATLEQLERPSLMPSRGARDALLHVDIAYSLGFNKPFPRFPFGSDSRAFGTSGVGGSQGFADPATGLGFAYTPNKLVVGYVDDPRARALRETTYRCLSSRGDAL